LRNVRLISKIGQTRGLLLLSLFIVPLLSQGCDAEEGSDPCVTSETTEMSIPPSEQHGYSAEDCFDMLIGVWEVPVPTLQGLEEEPPIFNIVISPSESGKPIQFGLATDPEIAPDCEGMRVPFKYSMQTLEGKVLEEGEAEAGSLMCTSSGCQAAFDDFNVLWVCFNAKSMLSEVQGIDETIQDLCVRFGSRAAVKGFFQTPDGISSGNWQETLDLRRTDLERGWL
jgi:hypothetical protein